MQPSSTVNPVNLIPTRFFVVLGILLSTLLIAYFASLRNALLFLVGGGLGLSFVVFGLGFAGPWRKFIVNREANGLITNLFLLAIASIIFIPALSLIPDTVGSIAPIGISVVVGSFLFGIGMQLGGGCGSGTLVAAGSGNQHSIIVLIFFIPGSLIGSLHIPWWIDQFNVGTVVLSESINNSFAIIIQVIVLLFLGVVIFFKAKKQNQLTKYFPNKRNLIGCGVVVALAFLALYISGRMWSITFANTLWGAKMADLMGFDIANTEFWQYPYPANALANSVLADVTSILNIGMLAAVAAYTFWFQQGNTPGNFAARKFTGAILAGLLMGYGARLAFGCNIGALFSGIASSSLHAWVWFLAAWLGNHVGIYLRPHFGMKN